MHGDFGSFPTSCCAVNLAADSLSLMFVSFQKKTKKRKTDSSSFSDKKPRERKPEPAPERQRVTSSVLKRNNSIKKAMRPDIEQTFVSKLEKLGVKSVSSCRSLLKELFCVSIWESVDPSLLLFNGSSRTRTACGAKS